MGSGGTFCPQKSFESTGSRRERAHPLDGCQESIACARSEHGSRRDGSRSGVALGFERATWARRRGRPVGRVRSAPSRRAGSIRPLAGAAARPAAAVVPASASASASRANWLAFDERPSSPLLPAVHTVVGPVNLHGTSLAKPPCSSLAVLVFDFGRPASARCVVPDPKLFAGPTSSTDSTANRLGLDGGATRGLCCGHLGRSSGASQRLGRASFTHAATTGMRGPSVEFWCELHVRGGCGHSRSTRRTSKLAVGVLSWREREIAAEEPSAVTIQRLPGSPSGGPCPF